MKIVLSSDGLKSQDIREKIIGMFSFAPAQASALVVCYTEPAYQMYLDETIQEIQSLGITKITTHNMYQGHNLDTSKQYDFLYMCGGNTFTILDTIRKQNISEYLISLVKNGAVYFGVSAGSIIAGPTIEISSVGIDGGDPNNVGMTDFRAFGLTDIIVSPHYTETEESSVLEFEKKHNLHVSRLRDGEYIVV